MYISGEDKCGESLENQVRRVAAAKVGLGGKYYWDRFALVTESIRIWNCDLKVHRTRVYP